jgi:hypothetical protein
MRLKHYLYLVLGPWLQAILVLAAGSKHGGPGMTLPFVALALTLPVGFYFAAFRNVPLGLDETRPALRLVLLAFGAMALSGLGFLYGLMLLARQSG